MHSLGDATHVLTKCIFSWRRDTCLDVIDGGGSVTGDVPWWVLTVIPQMEPRCSFCFSAPYSRKLSSRQHTYGVV